MWSGFLGYDHIHKDFIKLTGRAMSFFGAKDDATEWKQPGIRNDELDEFICLLLSLYRELKFSVGGLAIEEDMKGLFDVNEVWSKERYNFENLTFKINYSKSLN